MAHVVADKIQETSTTTGTGSLTLLGASSNCRAFSVVCTNNDTVFYRIEGTAGEWEQGKGTWTTGSVLVRNTVSSSSNAGALVNFSAGTKTVYMPHPAAVLGALTGDVSKAADSSVVTIVGSSMDPTSAFLVHKNGTAQNFTTSAATKMTWATEEFDEGNEFASNTFTAIAAGDYLFECAARVTAFGTGTTNMRLHLYKNGALYKTLMHVNALAGLTDITLQGAVACKGAATDTFDVYVEFVGLSAGTATIGGVSADTYFSAARFAVGVGFSDRDRADVMKRVSIGF